MFENSLLFTVACSLTFTVFGVAITWLKSRCAYWRRRGIPYIQPLPLLGNLRELLMLRVSFGELFRQFYANPSQQHAPVVGIYVFHTPALLVREPQLIQSVLIKNFNMFLNRYEAADAYHDTLGALTLPLAKYPIWRESRKKMAELFTSGRLRYSIYPPMWQIADELGLYIARCCKDNFTAPTAIIEVKEMCALFTTDLTMLLLFGSSANNLRQGNSHVRQHCRKLFEPSILKVLHFFAIFFLPKLNGLLRAKVFPKAYANFMRQLVMQAMTKRQLTGSRKDDLIDLLTEFTSVSAAETRLFAHQPDYITAQAAVFLLAGYETSSSLIAFTLYELAVQPQIQCRLRAEICKGFELDGMQRSLSYAQLNSMSYLHMVVSESLRLYPAAAFVNRECTPTHSEGFSLRPFADFSVPHGMPVYISILGLHRDPKYWPNPEYFDPERFSPQAIKSRQPMTYIPFGAGPHGCIGARLGLLQLKLGVVQILRNYKIETCSRTVPKIKFNPKSFMLQAENGIYLKFIKHVS